LGGGRSGERHYDVGGKAKVNARGEPQAGDPMKLPRTTQIRLTPKASSDRIGERRVNAAGEEVLAIHVTAPADRNKANEAMIRLLARHLGVPPSRLSIVRGLHADARRGLVIELSRHDEAAVAERLPETCPFTLEQVLGNWWPDA
jgi:uncharacterized protein